MTIAQAVREAGVEVETFLPPVNNWRFLPSRTLEVLKEEAKKIVYNCETFMEFHEKSTLPYVEAKEVWETAWENYETEEARATGN